MSRIPERRYHVARSAPIGRMDMRPRRKIRFGQRMKPRSWPTSLWFASGLFNRGIPSRRLAFVKLMRRTTNAQATGGEDRG